MLPSVVASELEQVASDAIRTAFHPTTPGFSGLIDRFLADRDQLLKRPFVSVSLPFREGSGRNWFPEIPLSFPPYLHQERAFERLLPGSPTNTLVAPLERILDEQLQAIGNAGNEKAPDRFLRDDILLITILVTFLEASAHQIRSRSLELALLLKLIGSDCYWYRTFSPRLANISPPAFALSQHDGAADQKRRQSVRRCHQHLSRAIKRVDFSFVCV